MTKLSPHLSQTRVGGIFKEKKITGLYANHMHECQTIKKIWKWNAMIYAEDTQAYLSFEPTERATEIKKDRRMHPRYKVYNTSTEISWLQLSW